MNTSSASRNAPMVMNDSSTSTRFSRRTRSSSSPRVMPARMRGPVGAVTSRPSITANRLVAAPSITSPSRTSTASSQPRSAACCRAMVLGSRLMLLMSQRAQRMSGTVITRAPPVIVPIGETVAITPGGTSLPGQA